MIGRLKSALERHGPVGFCRLLVRNAIYYASRLGRPDGPDESDVAFDRAYRIDTARVREIGTLDIDSPNARYAVRYQPSDSDVVTGILNRLSIRWGDFTFVDYGCGKGLVLLLASHYSLKRIVGVEFAPELVAIARENVRRYAAPGRKRFDIEVVQTDATQFEPPDGPLVCYFYNPFGEPVMRRVVERIEASLRRHPREIIVVYLNPRHETLFQASHLWVVAERGSDHVVLKSLIPLA